MNGAASSGRDPRLIAAHRGGLLSKARHQRLVAWAAACAERALPLFEAAGATPAQIEAERVWQRAVLPESSTDLVEWDMQRRSEKFGGVFD